VPDDNAAVASEPQTLSVDDGPDSSATTGSWPERVQRRLMSVPRPVYIHLAVLAGYMLAALIFDWTRESYLFSQRLPYGRDSGLYIWDYWWMAHCVTHLSNPFFTYFQAAPTGVPLGFHTLMPLEGALMTPFTLAFGAGFSLNLVVFLAPGLTCYPMYRAARLWLPTQAGAIAAGALFGFATIIAWNDWWEAQLAVGQIFIPLALEAAVRMGRRPTWRMAVIFGVVLGTALLSDQESAIIAGVVASLALLPWLLRRQQGGGLPLLVKLRALAIAAGVSVVIGGPQLLAMYIQGKKGYDTVPQGALAADYHNSGTTLAQIFSPSPRLGFFGAKSVFNYYYSVGSPSATLVCYGTVLTLLALFGLVVCWRRHGVKMLGLLWLAGTLLALGTAFSLTPSERYLPFPEVWHGIKVSMIMPYTWVARAPIFSSFREADRLAVFGLVAAALLAAAAVDWIARHATPALIVVAVLAFFEMGSVGAGGAAPIGSNNPQPPMSMPIHMPALDGPIAADHSNSIVVDLPMGVRSAVPIPNEGAGFNPEAQVQAANDGHPRAIAYVSRMSVLFLNKVKAHPFYGYIFDLQARFTSAFTNKLFGDHGQGSPELTAARNDAYKMHVGWAILWNSNRPERWLRHYIKAIGFKFQYRAGGAAVYRLPPRSSGTG
jgi:hypothetical protein